MAHLSGTLIDANGTVQNGVSCTVKDSGGAAAVIYSNAALTTTKTNPTTSNANGEWEAFVPPGHYTVDFGAPISRTISKQAPPCQQVGVRAVPNASQSITANTPTKVALNEEAAGLTGLEAWFDQTTNYRLTASWPCVVRVCAALEYSGMSDGESGTVMLYKNGTEIARVTETSAEASGKIAPALAFDVELAATDYLEIWTSQDGGGARSISTHASRNLSWATFSTLR